MGRGSSSCVSCGLNISFSFLFKAIVLVWNNDGRQAIVDSQVFPFPNRKGEVDQIKENILEIYVCRQCGEGCCPALLKASPGPPCNAGS